VKAQAKQWAERIDARSLRERLLIFGMAALAVVMLVTSLALDPLHAKRKVLLQQVAEQQSRVAAAQTQIQTLIAARSADPDAANRSRLTDLKSRIGQSEEKLASFQQGLVSSDRMTEVLKDLLSRNRGVKLVSLRTLPVTTLADEAGKPVPAQKEPAKEGQPIDPRNAIYKHGVEVTVEGSYGDLLGYVAELESMQWQVFWGGAALSVQTYPVSRLTLTLYTMSLEKTWLSV
jgi:MSHA biogenesis protein MshJ